MQFSLVTTTVISNASQHAQNHHINPHQFEYSLRIQRNQHSFLLLDVFSFDLIILHVTELLPLRPATEETFNNVVLAFKAFPPLSYCAVLWNLYLYMQVFFSEHQWFNSFSSAPRIYKIGKQLLKSQWDQLQQNFYYTDMCSERRLSPQALVRVIPGGTAIPGQNTITAHQCNGLCLFKHVDECLCTVQI